MSCSIIRQRYGTSDASVKAEKPRIVVFMPTYNGERFLSAQLDSILSQKGNFDLNITVRDDGSTDGTCDILRRYALEQGVNVIYGEHIGVNASIMEMVNQADGEAELYAFSDQDDVWYDFRMQEAVDACLYPCDDMPLLWTCHEDLTDEHLNVFGAMPFPKYLGNFHNAIIQNKTPGHTQVFNGALLRLLQGYPPDSIFVYDWVLYLLASAFGRVLYCARSCGMYRQHGANTIGYSANKWGHLTRRLRRLLNGSLRGISNQQEHFLARYEESLTVDARRVLGDFINNRGNLFSRIRFALTSKVRRDTPFESLQFRILYIFGVF